MSHAICHIQFLHIHDPHKWSAVYFVAGGAPPASSDDGASDGRSTDGHLLFRCGGARGGLHGRGAETEAEAEIAAEVAAEVAAETEAEIAAEIAAWTTAETEKQASHSYLAVSPTPGGAMHMHMHMHTHMHTHMHVCRLAHPRIAMAG